MQEVAEEVVQASLEVSIGELKMVKGADSLTEEVTLRRKGQAGVGQVEVSGEGEGNAGRKSSVQESWEVTRSSVLKDVQGSWGTGDGAEVRDQAGEVSGHQVMKGLTSQGKARLVSQG